MTLKAAGILFVTDTNHALYLKRAVREGGDFQGYWDFPGGTQIDNEDMEACAIRETEEEIGKLPKGSRSLHCRTIKNWRNSHPEPDKVDASPMPQPGEEVDYTTFLQKVDKQFVPVLSAEHIGYAWAPVDNPPSPLHPGCGIALARLGMDETGVVKAMVAGDLVSPQRFENVHLFAMRITGTGLSYRRSLDEFVWRDPKLYLNPQFLERCPGLPVIMEHPPTSILDSKEFNKRVVGSIVTAYIKGEDVWGIARIYDDPTIKILMEGPMSTSPSVVFRDPDVNLTVELENGEKLLIEGKPSLLDHLAICERGVWDKGGEPTGIQAIGDSEMTEEEKKALAEKQAAEEKARQDARIKADAEMSSKMDKLLGGIDSLGKRLDASDEKLGKMSSRMDAYEAKKDDDMSKKKDDDDDKMKKDAHKKDDDDDDAKKDDDDDDAKKDDDDDDKEEKHKMAVADKKKHKKDSETVPGKLDSAKADTKADTKADEDVQKKIKELEARLPVQITDEEYRQRVDVQARADVIYQAFGQHASRPQDGEGLLAYRRRLANKLKEHSPKWKPVDLSAVADAAAFDVIEKQIYADAMDAALHPVDIDENVIRPVVRVDQETGTRTIDFVGKHSFVRQFKPPTVTRVTKFLTPGRAQEDRS